LSNVKWLALKQFSGKLRYVRKIKALTKHVPEFPAWQTPANAKTVSTLDGDDFVKCLKPKKQIHLAVGGTLKITKLELQIIDTPEFQRLRRIRQLGLVHLVYPTALHTRFDHSLGTLQMANEMLSAIKTNLHNEGERNDISPYQEVLARLYALLHDLCHVPFGHLLEDELKVLNTRHDKNNLRLKHFLGSESKIAELISGVSVELYKELYALMSYSPKNAESPELSDLPTDLKPNNYFIHDLVSNTACADLLDYLRRDDFFCGMGFGVRYYFMSFLYLDKEKTSGLLRRVYINLYKEKSKQPRRDVLSDLCRLLETRYLLNERVYFHHTKLVAGSMLARALVEHASVLLKEMPESEAKTIESQPGTIHEKQQVALDLWLRDKADDEILQLLTKSSNKVASTLGKEILDRRLHKCECEINFCDVETRFKGNSDGGTFSESEDSLQNQILDIIEKLFFHNNGLFENSISRQRVEDEIAMLMGLVPGDVLIYAAQPKMNSKLAQMNVLWGDEPKQTAFKNINDPMVQGKLNSVNFGHTRLWSLRLLLRNNIAEMYRTKLLSDPEMARIKNGIEYFQRLCLSFTDGAKPKRRPVGNARGNSVRNLLKPFKRYFPSGSAFDAYAAEKQILIDALPDKRRSTVVLKTKTWIGNQGIIKSAPDNRAKGGNGILDPISKLDKFLTEMIDGKSSSSSL
jgi:uncharacterized protein